MPLVVLGLGQAEQLLLQLQDEGHIAATSCLHELLHQLEEAPTVPGCVSQGRWQVLSATDGVLQFGADSRGLCISC